jgi:tetratricopeptide (TPR) repeat protein
MDMKMRWLIAMVAAVALSVLGLAEEPQEKAESGRAVQKKYAPGSGRAVQGKQAFAPGRMPQTKEKALDPAAQDHYTRGMERYAKKELDQAISEYNEAIRLDPDSASVFCCRALAWSDMKQLDKAIADYDEAIRLDPNFAAAYNNRANAWAAKMEFAKAIADYGEAIQLDPNFAAAYKNRAWIWATCPAELVRDGKRAVESAVRACELTDWKDPSYLDTLAAAYAEAGDFDAAAKTQARAIDLTKDFAARLKAYQNKMRHRGAAELDVRLTQSRPSAFASTDIAPPFFVVPYDAIVYLSPAGGGAGAVTEFGVGTSEADHTPVFTGLPGHPEPNEEVKVGFFKTGSELPLYEKTEWGETYWAFTRDRKSESVRVAFYDQDNSLGMRGSAVEKTGPDTWVLHLDDAASFRNDDNDGDVLIQIRLEPAKAPAKP